MRVREFDEATITDAVLERVANTPDPRARQVSQALIKHRPSRLRGKALGQQSLHLEQRRRGRIRLVDSARARLKQGLLA
jgi:hypothetical protein